MSETECEPAPNPTPPAPAPAADPAPAPAADPAPASRSAGVSGYLAEPRPATGVSYPLRVQYCGACGLVLELCEFSANPEACRIWLERNLPEEFARLHTAAGAGADEEGGGGSAEDKKKRQTRGGKGNKEPKKKKDIDQRICLSRAQRGKKKSVTVVTGLVTFGIDLKEASKAFGQKFATGASVTGDDEIVIQGDVRDDLFDFLPERWPEIDEDRIEDLGDLKR